MKQELLLKDLEPGDCAVVRKIGNGNEIRRRLQDIGLIEGTVVECLGKSPCGDPHAYLIRGAVIAIREENARLISVVPTFGKAGERWD